MSQHLHNQLNVKEANTQQCFCCEMKYAWTDFNQILDLVSVVVHDDLGVLLKLFP